jgi:hypothetical protein
MEEASITTGTNLVRSSARILLSTSKPSIRGIQTRCQKRFFRFHVSERVSARTRDPPVTKTRGCWRMLRGGDMSPGDRHGHKVRELKRRVDAVIEEERERHKPPPPPVNEEHAAMRERIARLWAEFIGPLDPDSPDFKERLDERIAADPDIANIGAHILELAREEEEYLASQGVDPRPWDW